MVTLWLQTTASWIEDACYNRQLHHHDAIQTILGSSGFYLGFWVKFEEEDSKINGGHGSCGHSLQSSAGMPQMFSILSLLRAVWIEPCSFIIAINLRYYASGSRYPLGVCEKERNRISFPQ